MHKSGVIDLRSYKLEMLSEGDLDSRKEITDSD